MNVITQGGRGVTIKPRGSRGGREGTGQSVDGGCYFQAKRVL